MAYNNSNMMANLLAGGFAGLGEMLQGNRQTPYVIANWAGNGLARTGVGVMNNPRYRDWGSLGTTLGAGLNQLMGQDNNGFNKSNLFMKSGQDILGRLAGMTQNAGSKIHDMYRGMLNKRFGNVGDFANDIV